MLGTRLIQARPYDLETKGLVERANGYLGTSFLPGRTFASPADFNTQLTDWLTAKANTRRHATTKAVPAEALVADRAAMAVLPPVAPTTGTTMTTRLGRDYYVSLAGNAYSVHPEVIGRMITVTADLDRVVAMCGERMVADHQRLSGHKRTSIQQRASGSGGGATRAVPPTAGGEQPSRHRGPSRRPRRL